MEFYRDFQLFLFVSFGIGLIYLYYKDFLFSSSVFYFFSFLLFLFNGFRIIGYDLFTYKKIYDFYSVGDVYRVMEPSVEYISRISSMFDFGFFGFLSIYSSLTFILLCFLDRAFKAKGFFLVLFTVLFFAPGAMASIRATVASLFILLSCLAYNRNNYLLFCASLILAFNFHFSSIIVVLLLFLPSKLSGGHKNSSILFLCLFLMFNLVPSILNQLPSSIPIFSILSERIEAYLSRDGYELLNSARIALLLRWFLFAIGGYVIIMELYKFKHIFNSLESLLYKIAWFSVVFYLYCLLFGFVEVGFRIFDLLFVLSIPLLIKYSNEKIKITVVLMGCSNLFLMFMGYLSAKNSGFIGV